MSYRDTCKKYGVATGIHTSGADAVNFRIGQGFQFCAMASELRYMVGFMKDDIAKLNWSASPRGDLETTGPVAEAGTIVRY